MWIHLYGHLELKFEDCDYSVTDESLSITTLQVKVQREEEGNGNNMCDGAGAATGRQNVVYADISFSICV